MRCQRLYSSPSNKRLVQLPGELSKLWYYQQWNFNSKLGMRLKCQINKQHQRFFNWNTGLANLPRLGAKHVLKHLDWLGYHFQLAITQQLGNHRRDVVSWYNPSHCIGPVPANGWVNERSKKSARCSRQASKRGTLLQLPYWQRRNS